jgi:predicted ester cyclase
MFRMTNYILPLAFAIPVAAIAGTVLANDLPLPAVLTVLSGNGTAQAKAVEIAARTYAAFWNTGESSLAEQALSHDIMDRTLPEGRQQGKSGPIAASKAFRTAVPDLSAHIDELIVGADRAVVRLSFSGHFTGQFAGIQGHGVPIAFRAIDIYRVKDGKIVENWHLEDNLALMKQLGTMK